MKIVFFIMLALTLLTAISSFQDDWALTKRRMFDKEFNKQYTWWAAQELIGFVSPYILIGCVFYVVYKAIWALSA